jgi:chemotaxis protein MotA
MDIATIIGLIASFGLIIGAILVGGSLTSFLDAPSMLVVVGGTMGVALINFPLGRVLGAVKVAVNVFRFELPDVAEQNKRLLEFADVARKEGILALEAKLGSIEDDFLEKGVQLLVDGVDADKVRTILFDEINGIDMRHREGAKIFESLGASAPALGLVGTLIGLVQMLQSMDDPSTIGPAMAVALLTTFYGALLANVVFNPIAGKLKLRHEEEMLSKTLVVKGVLGIARGENPRILEQQLQAELSPAIREEAA